MDSPTSTTLHLSSIHFNQESQPAQCYWGCQRWSIYILALCRRRLFCCAVFPNKPLYNFFWRSGQRTDLSLNRPASAGDLVRIFSLAHVFCGWDMFPSGSWKPNNHFILQMLYLSRKLLSPMWSWFKMMTMCVILHSKQIKNPLNTHPNSQVLK